jgi:lipoprotein-releasing system permease protein
VAFSFEFFVAQRYLKAKRRQAAISVITAISIAGVAAGVMALVVAIGINNGFRGTLQRNLLGATAHVTLTERGSSEGISAWRELSQKLAALPGVSEASPALYEKVFLNAGGNSAGAVIKGLDMNSPRLAKDLIPFVKQGSWKALQGDGAAEAVPALLIGTKLAESLGLRVGNYVQVINPLGELTPFGPRPSYHRMRIVGSVETGFYDVDANFAFMSLPALQSMMSLGDVVNAIELKMANIEAAPELADQAQKLAGSRFSTTHWMEQNKQLLGALKMERVVSIITIGLIQMIAALNIFITLVMMVMEKQRDIAILLSMGARVQQIRNIFICQGVLIGGVGTVIGLFLGYGISYVADHYRLIQLSEEIYSIPYVPFAPNPMDALWITALAMGISLLATLYPAASATRVAPAESLRYE